MTMRNILLTTLLALGLGACTNGQNKTTETSGAHHVIDAKAFASRPADAQLVDIRTPEEWNAGIIEGALLYNFYSPDFEKMVSALDMEQPIYVYCAAGGRSGNASEMLKKKGYTVYDLKGGMGAWSAANMPTVPPQK